jgi:hypothetical protein
VQLLKSTNSGVTCCCCWNAALFLSLQVDHKNSATMIILVGLFLCCVMEQVSKSINVWICPKVLDVPASKLRMRDHLSLTSRHIENKYTIVSAGALHLGRP